jgi:hypothetical protein
VVRCRWRALQTNLKNSGYSESERNKLKVCLINTFNYVIVITQFPLRSVLYKTSYNTQYFPMEQYTSNRTDMQSLQAIVKLLS